MHGVSTNVSINSILIKGFHCSFRPGFRLRKNRVFEPVWTKIKFSAHWCLDEMWRKKMKVDTSRFIRISVLKYKYIINLIAWLLTLNDFVRCITKDFVAPYVGSVPIGANPAADPIIIHRPSLFDSIRGSIILNIIDGTIALRFDIRHNSLRGCLWYPWIRPVVSSPRPALLTRTVTLSFLNLT